MDEITSVNCPYLSTANIKSLQENGVKTLLDFISAPKEKVLSFGVKDVNYDVTRDVILETLQPYPVSALEYFTGDKIVPRSTGLKGLDKMLGGGLFSGDILELFGKTGTGKTQLCLYLASQYCACDKTPSVIYFDLKNDFNATRLLKMLNQDENKLDQVMIFHKENMDQLIKELDDIKNQSVGGIDSFYSKCRLLIIDSVPMAMYPAATSNFYSWRHIQEKLLHRLHWLANHLHMAVVLVNHAVTPRTSEQDNEILKVKPAMGQYWHSKINISIYLERSRNTDQISRFKGTLNKSFRSAVGQTFDFFIGPNAIEDVTVINDEEVEERFTGSSPNSNVITEESTLNNAE